MKKFITKNRKIIFIPTIIWCLTMINLLLNITLDIPFFPYVDMINIISGLLVFILATIISFYDRENMNHNKKL